MKSFLPISLALVTSASCAAEPDDAPSDSGVDPQEASAPDAAPDAHLPDAQAVVPPPSMSLNLLFSSLQSEATGTPPASFASFGMSARVDLDVNGSKAEALWMAPYAEPRPLTVSFEPEAVVLRGQGIVGVVPCSTIEEQWTEVRIEREADGALGNTFEATGSSGIRVGHGVNPCALTADGAVGPDMRAPELRAGWTPVLGTGELLPWSEASLEFSEPVDPQGLETLATVVQSQNGTDVVLPVDWVEQTGPSGMRSAKGVLRDWTAASPQSTVLRLAEGFSDRAGNLSTASELAKEVLDVGTLVPAYDFTTGTAPGAAWGTVELLSGEQAASCDAAACLAIGPIDTCVERTWSTGVAGRLDLGGKKRVAFRYKVQAGAGVLFQLAAPGLGAPILVAGEGSCLQPSDGGPCEGEWDDLIVDVPPGATEVGFAITLSSAYCEQAYAGMSCGDDTWPYWTQLSVVVQHVKPVD